jgi:pyruvate-formate lyase
MTTPNLWDIVHTLRQSVTVDPAMPVPLREARLFRHTIEHLPIGLEDGESLAGDFGAAYLDEAEQASFPRAAATPATPLPEPMQQLARFRCNAGYTPAHTCADYARVVQGGLQEALDEIAAARQQGGADPAILDAMQESIAAVAAWARRFAVLAERLAVATPEPERRGRLLRLAKACRHVPLQPARTFFEAVQGIWLVHTAIGISERCTASLSLGRLDQYLWPFYQRDLAAGVPAEDLRATLRDLWLKLNRFGDAACAVNLGGLDAAGRDLCNPLTRLIIELSKELALPSPILAARVHADLPEDVFASLLDARLFSAGQPTFYGEIPCRQAMLRRGVPAAEVHRFTMNSCMGLVMPGEEISDMWGAVLNLLLPLELALNGGRPFAAELPLALRTRALAAYASFEELQAKFEEYAAELLGLLVAENRRQMADWAANRPNPFLSAITRGCIASGTDRAAAGARYHSVIVEGFGWCNASDALTAIRRLVFSERRFSLEALVRAARSDYRDDPALRTALLACPKFGNGDSEADGMAARVTAGFAAMVSGHSSGNIAFLPSYHTLNAHVGAGKITAASLDGRRAGDPLGKNVGPMPGAIHCGPTGVILSASHLDQGALGGGQALDLSVDPLLVAQPAWQAAFRALLLTYFQRGGLQIQVNGVTAATLRSALAAPAEHQDLTVRIGGFSARFNSLGHEVQAEVIQRTEQGL